MTIETPRLTSTVRGGAAKIVGVFVALWGLLGACAPDGEAVRDTEAKLEAQAEAAPPTTADALLAEPPEAPAGDTDSTSQAEPAPEATETPVDSGRTPVQDGTYLVGEGIQAGRHAFHTEGSCSWERLAGFTGDFDETLARGFTSGYFIVEVLDSDAGFELSCYGGSTYKVNGWSEVGTRLTPQSPTVPSGVYAVGADIEAGLYQLNGTCSWERLAGFTGDFDEVLARDFTDGPFIVEILDSDVGFELSCF